MRGAGALIHHHHAQSPLAGLDDEILAARCRAGIGLGTGRRHAAAHARHDDGDRRARRHLIEAPRPRMASHADRSLLDFARFGAHKT